MENKCRIIDLKPISDSRGSLIAIEGSPLIPFKVRRIFYMYGIDGESVRGQHANKKSKFLLVCLKGSCNVSVETKDYKEEFVLDSCEKGLYIPNLVWKEMKNFSSDSILLCISNKKYTSNEYIRNKEDL